MMLRNFGGHPTGCCYGTNDSHGATAQSHHTGRISP